MLDLLSAYRVYVLYNNYNNNMLPRTMKLGVTTLAMQRSLLGFVVELWST